MKKVVCLLIACVLLLCGCSNGDLSKDIVFTRKENGNMVSSTGVEYVYFRSEENDDIDYIGPVEFLGAVEGEESLSSHLTSSYQTGMFALKSSDNNDVLIRRAPDNEWCLIYRKATLPEIDWSVDNCIRLEFVTWEWDGDDTPHAYCNGGIADKAEVAQFLSQIRYQDPVDSDEIIDRVKNLGGKGESAYLYGFIYGFFEDEYDLAFITRVFSYDDLVYTLWIGENEYDLPVEWMGKFIDTQCTNKE